MLTTGRILGESLINTVMNQMYYDLNRIVPIGRNRNKIKRSILLLIIRLMGANRDSIVAIVMDGNKNNSIHCFIKLKNAQLQTVKK